MKKLTKPLLIKVALILVNILLAIFIIKELQILRLIQIIITLILPILFGYTIAWLLKPIMLYLNRILGNVVFATGLTYLFVFMLIGTLGYLAFPVIAQEMQDLIGFLVDLFELVDPEYIENIDLSSIGTRVINWLNITINNIKDIILNLLYALFFGFFFLIYHRKVSAFFAKRVPTDLIYELSINLKAFVRGNLITTLVLFIISVTIFFFLDLPYFLLLAILISITNVIPYIGPYIGGVPATIIAFGISSNYGFIVLGTVILLQIIDNFLVTPFVMSRTLKINQIMIMLGLIFFGYFFGVIGMLISTPIICVIKTLYKYNKEHHLVKIPFLDK